MSVSRMREEARSELSRRVIVAVPVAVVLVGIVIISQTLLALALLVFGWICLVEFWNMTEEQRTPKKEAAMVLPSMIIFTVMMVWVLHGTFLDAIGVLAAGVTTVFIAVVASPWAMEESRKVSVKRVWQQNESRYYGLLWVGVPLACAVLLRGMHHGSWLVVDVLVAVVVSDSAAYLGGRTFGRHKLAPIISPNKTVEGWVIGIGAAVVAVYLIGLLQSWLPTWQALVFGLTVAVVSTLGDLFESFMKRRADIKDSGTLFGAHGGALDRADAALFGVVAGYGLAQLFGL